MIPVKKYDPKVFRMLIEFVHSGVVTLNAETAPGKYHITSRQYTYMYAIRFKFCSFKDDKLQTKRCGTFHIILPWIVIGTF